MANRFNRHRYTVYDMMEMSGAFESNPANADSRDPVSGEGLYKGPVQYPKMFYHPQGEERITKAAEVQVTPMGPKLVNEQKEIIWQLARNERDAKALLAEGWHEHPADAIAAREGTEGAPPKSAAQTIEQLQAQMADLKRQLAAASPEEAA